MNRVGRDPGYPQDDSHPVACVSWDDAQAYIAWLNQVVPNGHYRLLTEAEWEYAARAQAAGGPRTEFFTGAKIEPEQAQYAWSISYAGSAKRANNPTGTAPAGSFPPNAFDLRDMAGNLWQWVQDCYHHSYTGAPTDGSAWDKDCGSSVSRFLRGGSWDNYPRHLRSADRGRIQPGFRGSFLGFRVARTL